MYGLLPGESSEPVSGLCLVGKGDAPLAQWSVIHMNGQSLDAPEASLRPPAFGRHPPTFPATGRGCGSAGIAQAGSKIEPGGASCRRKGNFLLTKWSQ